MQESPTYPHTLAQWIYVVLAGFVLYGGGLITAWFKRKREPVEIDKLKAETRNIHITSENAQSGMTLETLREIQLVIQKAEQRREEWLQREEQMRGQIVFWRNKAEELDGELIDVRYELAQTETRLTKKTHELNVAMAILMKHEISYSELDQPKE